MNETPIGILGNVAATAVLAFGIVATVLLVVLLVDLCRSGKDKESGK